MFELTSSVLYAEINCLCFFLLSWVLLTIKKESDEQRFTKLLTRVIISEFAMLILELARHFSSETFEYTVQSSSFPPSVVIYSLGLVVSSFVTYYWFLFVREICKLLYKANPFNLQHKKSFRKRHFKDILFSMPAFIVASISVLGLIIALFTGATGGFYEKTHFIVRIVHKVITYGYFSISSFFILISSIKRFGKISWLSPLSKISLVILPFISGCLGILFKSGYFAWQIVVILVVIVFFDMQMSRVSNDGLTGLNNRKAFDKFFDSVINEYRTGKFLFLFIIDVDNFKNINDSYGHLEGDSVLVLIANAMKDACRSKDGFIARYGGDEFVILVWLRNEEEAIAFVREIKSFVQVKASTVELPYDLDVSIGYSCRSVEEFGNSVQLFKHADDALYEAKKEKKVKKL